MDGLDSQLTKILAGCRGAGEVEVSPPMLAKLIAKASDGCQK